MLLTDIAKETVKIVSEGEYRAPSGRVVSIREEIARSTAGTRLFRPTEFPLPLASPPSTSSSCVVEVTSEKTGRATQRLVCEEGVANVLALNFASAKNPGGGFLGGARAQEEDLSRCSSLHHALLTQPEFYRVNRATPSLLYTDHLIYSPGIVFFRDDELTLLDQPFCVSIITSPAPNAGEVLARQPDAQREIRATLERRARQVLQVAAMHGHRSLVLGAWGCGVFRNNPVDVAKAFADGLESMAGAFDRVVFAVYERTSDGPNLRAFRAQFEAAV